MEKYISLNQLRPGQTGIVCKLNTKGSMRRRLLDIGVVKDTRIKCVGRSACGDPTAYLIRGAVIAIRSEDCRNIIIRLG